MALQRPGASGGAHFTPPAAPTTQAALLAQAGSALAPDDPKLDALITGSYLQLMLTAKDESIRLEATRDLTHTRGFFERSQAKAAVVGAAAAAQIIARPDVFARLVEGLTDLGVARPDQAAALKAAVVLPPDAAPDAPPASPGAPEAPLDPSAQGA